MDHACAELPSPGPLPYLLVVCNSRGLSDRPPVRDPYAHRAGGFVSGYAYNTTLKPLRLDHRVCIDLVGRAQRQGEIIAGASHLPRARGAAPSRAVTLEVSFDDGATWQRHGDDAWRGRLDVPRGARFTSVFGLKCRRLTGAGPRRRAPAPGRVGR
ncbi:hypothetical protein ACWDA7_27775 [Streptomyces sp. NPDC001156]